MFFVFFLTAVGMQRERGCYPPLSESCVRMGSGFGVTAGAVSRVLALSSLHPLFIVPRFVVQEPREAVPVLLKEIYKMPSR